MAHALSIAEAAEKLQHDPHFPWSLTGVTTPCALQSTGTDGGKLAAPQAANDSACDEGSAGLAARWAGDEVVVTWLLELAAGCGRCGSGLSTEVDRLNHSSTDESL